MQSDNVLRGYLLVAISSLGFGTVGVWAKWGYQAGFTPLTLLVLRFGLASLLLWAMVLIRYRRIPWLGIRGVAALFLQGGVFYALTASSLFQAWNLLPAGIAHMLFYLHPLLTTLLASAVWREKIIPAQIIALLIAVVGSALLAGSAFSGDLSLTGVFFALTASLTYAAFTLGGQVTRDLGSPLVTCAYSTTACFLSLALWARPNWQWLRGLSAEQWGIGFGVALVATVIGIMFFLAGISIIGASKAAIVAALESASGVVFSLVFLHERLNGGQLAGIVCILTSVAVLAVARTPTKRSSINETA